MLPDLFRDEVFRIETRRLWLRWPRLADAPRLQEAASAPEVAQMTASWPHPLPEGEAARRIERMRQGNANGDCLVLAMTPKREPDCLIGMLGVHLAAGEDHLTLGCLLATPYHGRGLMSEAVRGLASAVFTYSGYRRIRAASRIINPASARVLDKCGFVPIGPGLQEAAARGGAIEVDCFELRREDWRRTLAWGRPAAQDCGEARAS
ncbi:MAG TPA: GNAT family N-acetyltransferase [Hyphomicrobiaceae bacterium]|nr:GNAT family N-acetyltransferase [Hyphomicrobiaceae bacterium]